MGILASGVRACRRARPRLRRQGARWAPVRRHRRPPPLPPPVTAPTIPVAVSVTSSTTFSAFWPAPEAAPPTGPPTAPPTFSVVPPTTPPTAPPAPPTTSPTAPPTGPIGPGRTSTTPPGVGTTGGGVPTMGGTVGVPLGTDGPVGPSAVGPAPPAAAAARWVGGTSSARSEKLTAVPSVRPSTRGDCCCSLCEVSEADAAVPVVSNGAAIALEPAATRAAVPRAWASVAAGTVWDAEHGHLGQPGDRTLGATQPRCRDGDHGPHDHGVELAAGASDELAVGGSAGDRPTVRTGRGHDVERVSDRDDPRAVRDLLAAQALRVATAVVHLVVLDDHVAPLGEPGHERCGQVGSGDRVVPQELPLLVRRLGRLVQQLGRDRQLPDVVQERGPPQPVAAGLRHPELDREQLGEQAHPLRVTAGGAVVVVERGDEDEDLASHLLRVLAGASQPSDVLLHGVPAHGVAGHLES